MSELLIALGLVFVIEGLIWALFPGYAVRMLEAARELGESNLRTAGLFAIALGVAIVWLVKSMI